MQGTHVFEYAKFETDIVKLVVQVEYQTFHEALMLFILNLYEFVTHVDGVMMHFENIFCETHHEQKISIVECYSRLGFRVTKTSYIWFVHGK